MKIFETIDEENTVSIPNEIIVLHVKLGDRQVNINDLKVISLQYDQLQTLIANIRCGIMGYTIYDQEYKILEFENLNMLMNPGDWVQIQLTERKKSHA